ncbi:hypothetical protein [Pseudanabaena sp. PCC 6802]|uniref:hypothetical protein n=1 Tax=Pseudanabaena sp. PCC 6802 TaxID=118173 RepID=UPI00035F58F9|nr:hypothetical protein [Pseudanabaena sp. PCC 6802]
MTRRDDSDRLLPDYDLDKGKPSNEVPPNSRPVEYDRVPSGYEPIGQIELIGRVFRGLVRGRFPWWVLILAWICFGSLAWIYAYGAVVAIVVAFTSGAWISFAVYFIFFIAMSVMSAAFFSILWRATLAKLSNRKRGRK